MTAVEIEYCVPCEMLDRAQTLQEALLSEYGQRLERVTLVTGDGGVFEVRLDGDVVFDKETDEYSVDGIVDAVGEQLSTTA